MNFFWFDSTKKVNSILFENVKTCAAPSHILDLVYGVDGIPL